MSTYFFSRHHNPAKRRTVLRNVAANATIVLPKGSAIRRVLLNNKTTNAVTGGVRIGTAAGGSQVVAATPVNGDALLDLTVASSSLAKVDQTLYVEAATAWNNAVVDIVVNYDQVPFIDTEYQPGSLNLDPNLGSATRPGSRQ